jgi:hypothetical protein
MVFRNRSQAFVDDWIKVIEADETVWDQNAFNELVRKGQQFMPDDPNHYFKGETAVKWVLCSRRCHRVHSGAPLPHPPSCSAADPRKVDCKDCWVSVRAVLFQVTMASC